MANFFRLREYFVLLCLLPCVLASEKVPVFVWTNDLSVSFPQQLAGHSMSRNEFQKSFVDDLTSVSQDNVVLFIQNKLSVSDFSHFSDAYNANGEQNSFRHLKSLMSEMTSTYLSSVAMPTSVLMDAKNMKSRQIKIVENPDEVFLNDLDGPHLIVVRLPESHHSRKSFKQLDEIVGKVTSQLKMLTRRFIAFYTGAVPSRSAFPNTSRQNRRLMATTPEASGIFVNVSDLFYLYTRNLTLAWMNSSVVIESENLNVDEDKSKCNATEFCEIYLSFQTINHMSIHNPQIQFGFNQTANTNSGYWYLSQFSLSFATVENGSMNVIEYDTRFVDQTPIGYSYHCNNLPPLEVKNASGVDMEGAPKIIFDNFQVQAFVLKSGQFGFYNECVGFFTPAIWMFLISAVILLAVLFFGIIMLWNIETQDRYDDPKGKTITINASD